VAIIDLSQPIYTGMPVYPILPKTFLHRYHTFEEFEDGRMWPASTDILTMSTHAGTHIDAPAHIKPGVTTIDQADLSVMMGDAVWLNVSSNEPGEEVSLAELQRGLKDIGVEIRPRLIVLFHTGMSKRWGRPEYGQATIGISPEAVEWMLDQGVVVYGLDGPSPDIDYKNLPNHQLLARRRASPSSGSPSPCATPPEHPSGRWPSWMRACEETTALRGSPPRQVIPHSAIRQTAGGQVPIPQSAGLGKEEFQ
jgi:kynurenine formamidase